MSVETNLRDELARTKLEYEQKLLEAKQPSEVVKNNLVSEYIRLKSQLSAEHIELNEKLDKVNETVKSLNGIHYRYKCLLKQDERSQIHKVDKYFLKRNDLKKKHTS